MVEFRNKKQFDVLRALGLFFLFILAVGIGYSAIQTNQLISTGNSLISGDLNVTGNLIFPSGQSSQIIGDGLNITGLNYTVFNNRGRIQWRDSTGTIVNVLQMLQNNMTYLQSPNGGITLQTKGDTDQSITDRVVIGTGLAVIPDFDIKNANLHINNNNLTVDGYENVGTLAGSGNAYVCVDSAGNLYRSVVVCV